jgi:hypothetical protein
VPAELLRRFDHALRTWDRHGAGCDPCLTQGRWFCAEGTTFTHEVGAIRARILRSAGRRRTLSVSIGVGRRLRGIVTARVGPLP